ncbi:MAG: hypothetical protein KGL16_06430, partial [Acidobacteriota bacterium]|nr:hypothetical protein [Acidobacteriota bacterium]
MSERDGDHRLREEDEGLAARAVAKFPLAAEPPRFFEALRERMQEHDRSSARRWRRVSALLAVVAA